MKAELDFLEKQKPKVYRSIGAGAGISAAYDPVLGIPVAIPGLVGMVRDAGVRHLIKERLLKKPRAARLMAERFKGTEHALFFSRIAEKARETQKKRLAKSLKK